MGENWEEVGAWNPHEESVSHRREGSTVAKLPEGQVRPGLRTDKLDLVLCCRGWLLDLAL